MTALVVLSTNVRQLDGLYSLNDLHRASGGEAKHQPALFLRLDQTQALIREIGNSTDLQSLKTTPGRNGGTYACRELVIAYAAWISAAFHLQVIRVFLAQVEHGNVPAPLAALSDQQWLLRFGSDGKPYMRALAVDERVLSPRLISLIVGTTEFPAELLPDLLGNALTRLIGMSGVVPKIKNAQDEAVDDLFAAFADRMGRLEAKRREIRKDTAEDRA